MIKLEIDKRIQVAIAVVVLLFLFVSSGLYVWAKQYHGRIAPNVAVAGIDIGGMSFLTAEETIQSKIDDILTSGIPVHVNNDSRQLPLSTFVTTDLIEDVVFDLPLTFEEAKQVGRSEKPAVEVFLLLKQLFENTNIPLHVELNEESIARTVYGLFPEVEEPVQNAQFEITKTLGVFDVEVTKEVQGSEFAFVVFFEELLEQMKMLDTTQIEIALVSKTPEVTRSDANILAKKALDFISTFEITLTYNEDEWLLGPEKISTFLQPSADGFVVDQEVFVEQIADVKESIEREAQDARFEIIENRVTEFMGSQQGVVIDQEVLVASLELALNDESLEPEPIEIQIMDVDPIVETGEVNDLGITEILGTGTSSYRGSPSNRRKNIQNGVDLLNGLLIPPGETLSLVESLKPFTFDNGYLPELVIKGDKIEPELGGGLCQIGKIGRASCRERV